MTTLCCSKFDANGNLIFSYCSVNLHCPPGWMETVVNECTACPTVGNQDDIVSEIEKDEPGASQFASFG